MSNEAKYQPSLVQCRRVLAELYNTHSNMSLEMRFKILSALGYHDAPKMVGALLAEQAYLSPDGEIIYNAVEASSEDNPPRARARLMKRDD